jgi:hypothetical protein
VPSSAEVLTASLVSAGRTSSEGFGSRSTRASRAPSARSASLKARYVACDRLTTIGKGSGTKAKVAEAALRAGVVPFDGHQAAYGRVAEGLHLHTWSITDHEIASNFPEPLDLGKGCEVFGPPKSVG